MFKCLGVYLVFSLGSQCKTTVLVFATTSQGVLVSSMESVTPWLHTFPLPRVFLESSSPTTEIVVILLSAGVLFTGFCVS